MGRLKTEHLAMDGATRGEVNVKYEVYVDTEGFFTTTLPEEFVAKLEAAQIPTEVNRARNKGYVYGRTLTELNARVKDIAVELVSRKLVEEKIVISYQLGTACNYNVTDDGEIYPNGMHGKGGTWVEGTKKPFSMDLLPFGLQVYVRPYLKKTFVYKSGTTKVEYSNIKESENQPNLNWLNDLIRIGKVENTKLHEIDYTENVAGVFVDIVKALFRMNEKIKDFTTPEAISKIAENKTKLLS